MFVKAEIGGPVLDKHIQFFETSVIQKNLETLSCCKLSFLVLVVNPPLSPSKECLGFALMEIIDEAM